MTSNRLTAAMNHQVRVTPAGLLAFAAVMGVVAVILGAAVLVAAAHCDLYGAVALLGFSTTSALLGGFALAARHRCC